MSTSIDNKIVSMQFDNQRFEAKMAETMKSLDKLKTSLDFSNSRKSMEELNAASRNFNMNPMASAIDGVSNKFLALATVAITALSNITNRAVDAGLRFVKAFTFSPIQEGFQEFETNMNSIQTILANTKSDGSTLADVNKALDELNTYSDQTIYNFSEMARNIGTFTAAGVDLDSSVKGIKGIANLAAISGSNSQQASTAMYQLSQALAAGKVNLMDWNSVVNAGMGGEVFKKALFETGKAMGTITDVPLGATFEEWEKKGGTFREQMQKGWLTADVLSNTLQAFAGDLDFAAFKQLGFSDAAAKQMVELGKLGKASATEVKTFTQLIGTVKESVASGWSQSFRTIIGDFKESKVLFTGMSDAIGKVVSDSADARNEMLGGWKAFGGRELLLEGFKNAIKAVGAVLKPIKEAFREIFPRKTAGDLVKWTIQFTAFTKKLMIGGETADKIKRTFARFFSIFKIGFSIFKGIFGLVTSALGGLSGVGSSFLDFTANLGDTIVSLQEALVEGGGIATFFQKLGKAIQAPIEFIKDFKKNVADLFSGFTGGEVAEQTLDRVGTRFSFLTSIVKAVGNAFEWVWDRLEGVRKVFSEVFDYIVDWFADLGKRISDAMKPGDFNAAVDAVNVGLLGGIALILKKFLDNGLNLNIFNGDLIENISNTFEELTSTLKAMQTQIKSKALLNIAIAVGVLTASVLVLSLIDSKALTKALTALAVGFGQLVGAMALLDKLGLAANAAKLTVLAGGMILLSVAAVILSIAVKSLSKLSWSELAKGLAGVTAMLLAMAFATRLIAADTGGLIRAGIAMIAISLALIVMAKAVKAFGSMKLGEMGKGLVGVGVGLTILTIAINKMPSGMFSTGLALVAISVSLLILSKAVQSFGNIEWGILGKGLLGVGGALLAIGLAMRVMPKNMLATSAGLLILSIALNIIAQAVRILGELDLGTLAKGIGAIAAVLLILAIAANVMTGAVVGAAAMLIVSASLLILSKVIKDLGKLSLKQIGIGLLAIAGAIAILGIAAAVLSSVIPAMIGLGIALVTVGAGFALFGAGVFLVAKSFEILAKAGKAGVDVFLDILEGLIRALPRFVKAFAEGILEMAQTILDGAPAFVAGIGALIGKILDTITELAPKIAEAFGAILLNMIALVREVGPPFIEAGIYLITSFLQGIRDNITNITTLVIDIITRFVDTLASEMPRIVTSAAGLITSFLTELGNHAEELVAAGTAVLVSFLEGLSESVDEIATAVGKLIADIILAIGGLATDITEAGFQALKDFLEGLTGNVVEVVKAVGEMIVQFIEAVGGEAVRIGNAGTQALVDFLEGIANNIDKVCTSARKVVSKFVGCIASFGYMVLAAGAGIVGKVVSGIVSNLSKLVGAATKVILKIRDALVSTTNFKRIFDAGVGLLGELRRGIANAITNGWETLKNLGKRVIEGIIEGLKSMGGTIKDGAGWVKDKLVGAMGTAFKINSPAKVMIPHGSAIIEGMALGMKNTKPLISQIDKTADTTLQAFNDSFKKINDKTLSISDIQPKITPVLDLTDVITKAKTLDSLISSPTLSADLSLTRAQVISDNQLQSTEEDVTPTAPTTVEMNFHQTNTSPKPLNTAEILKKTKNQLAQAKEELELL